MSDHGQVTSTKLTRVPHRRARARENLTTIVVSTIGVMFLVLPVNFFWAYAFNDDVRWVDHAGFLIRTLLVVVLLSAALTSTVSRRSGQSRERAAVGTLLVSSSVLLLGGALYSLLNLLPDLDSAVGASASDLACVVMAVLLFVTGLLSLAAGEHLTFPRR